MNRPVSLAILIVGIVLIIFGAQASDSVGSSFSRFFTGEPTDRTIWLLLGGLVAVIAIFLPSLLLVPGVLPIWDRLKTRPEARGAVAGLGAVVVGLVAAALWNPVLTSAIRRPNDWALVAAAYVFLAVARLPPWAVVIGFAAATGLLT